MGQAEKTWIVLVLLTLGAAWLAETGRAGWPLAIVVASLILFKGGMVINRYMDMTNARADFRYLLYLFVGIIALMVLLTQGFAGTIKHLTTIY